MRINSATFLAWLTIATALLALQATPALVPRVEAAIQPLPTLWRPYGPYASQVLATVYTSETPELAAFNAGELDWFDWTLPPAQVPGLVGNPDALVSNPIAEAGIFQVDLNSRYPILGVTMQQPRSTACDPGLFGTCSSLEPSPAGVQVRKAIAHLIDKTGFVNSGECAGGQCIAPDDQIPAAVCLENVAPCSSLAQRVAWDAGFPHSASAACLTGTTPCAYKIAPGPGLGRPSAADLQAAREHLAAAGIPDSDGDGLFDFPATGQTLFAIRSDDAKRTQIGIVMSDALDSLFETGPGGAPVIFRLFSNILGGRIFISEPDADWGLYTGGWGLGLDATHIFPLYDSHFASDFCGGTPSLFNLNYGFHCDNLFDLKIEKGTFDAKTLPAFNTPHAEASDLAGNNVMTIPVYSRAARTLAHNGWDGVLDYKGDGIANTANWFSMRAKPGFVSTGGLGLPGGGNPNLLRTGFRQGTSQLNVFHAGTVWESYVIFNILDAPGGFNPRAVTNPFFEPYETSVTLVTEEFTTLGAVEGTADTTPVTVIQMVFRDDLAFHDGVQVTATDFLASGLAYRDVPMGGFGFAANWAPLLSSSVPIPNSNVANSVQLVFDGQTFLHKLNMIGSPILPVHLWDTSGDGFICSALDIGSCAGRAADATVDITFDPMAAGIMVGHGPWMCVSQTGHVGGTCSETAAGVSGGQAIGAGGRFLFTRYDNYMLGTPNLVGTPLHKFAQSDLARNWVITVADFALVPDADLALKLLVISILDQKLGGVPGQTANDVDLGNAGNTVYSIGPNP